MSASRIPTDRGMESEITGRTGKSSEEERNESAIRRLIPEIWGKGNLNAVDELYAPNFVDHSAPKGFPPNREGIKQQVQMYRKAFPDSQVTIGEVITEGDRAAGRFTLTGTHKGELFGIPPTGKHVTVEGLALGRYENGKLVEGWEVADTQKLMEQLGANMGASKPSM